MIADKIMIMTPFTVLEILIPDFDDDSFIFDQLRFVFSNNEFMNLNFTQS